MFLWQVFTLLLHHRLSNSLVTPVRTFVLRQTPTYRPILVLQADEYGHSFTNPLFTVLTPVTPNSSTSLHKQRTIVYTMGVWCSNCAALTPKKNRPQKFARSFQCSHNPKNVFELQRSYVVKMNGEILWRCGTWHIVVGRQVSKNAVEEAIWKFIVPGNFDIHMFVIFAAVFTYLTLTRNKFTIKCT
jgi:hypothetical protein